MLEPTNGPIGRPRAHTTAVKEGPKLDGMDVHELITYKAELGNRLVETIEARDRARAGVRANEDEALRIEHEVERVQEALNQLLS